MQGSSRTSFAEARDALVSRSAEPGFDAVGAELLSVSTVLASSTQLRGALTEAGRESAERAGLARSVFDGKVSQLAAEIVSDAADRRWSQPRDLVDAVESLGVEATLIVAERAGRADTVEDELFRVDRLVAGDPGLQRALNEPSVADSAKAELLDAILAGKVADETAALVSHVVTHPRGRRLEPALAELVEVSARRRERLLAKVKAAGPLTADQHERLKAALNRIYPQQIDLQVEVDPAVQGGVTVQVGDEVIDGSVAHRLEQIRRLMGAR